VNNAQASKDKIVRLDDLIAGSFDSDAIILIFRWISSAKKQPIYFEISKSASLFKP
jgi:hypothetical protein